MTEQPPSAIGTVAQEAARLIEEMATMARSTYSHVKDPNPYAPEPDSEPASPNPSASRDAPRAADGVGDDREAGDESSTGVCSMCGADGDDTPESCRICPLCRGIALLRSVRPETVDLLADLALSMAAGLRDVATRSRASAPASSSRPPAGSPPDGERATVQDIPVDDESE
jgi:hypothetical protein